MWRALAQCLLTRTQLQFRRVQIQAFCPVCTEESEIIFHSLVLCPFARQCWMLLNVQIDVDQNVDFGTWIMKTWSASNARLRAESVVLCWTLWRARNDLVWNQKHSTVNKVVAAAKQYLTQWTIAKNRSYIIPLQPLADGDEAVSWVKPQPNKVKVSFDAAIFETREQIGFGIVARDSEGGLVEAKLW